MPVSNSFVSPCSNSFGLNLSGGVRLWLSTIHLSSHKTIHLSPSLAGGVRLFGCLEFICLFIKRFICLPVWLVVSGFWAVCNSFVSRYGNLFVSQSGWWCPALGLSRIHLSLHITIHLSPKLCPAFWLSPVHLFRHITIHLSPSRAGGVWLSVSNSFVFPKTIHLFPSLAGSVRLSGCLQFICLRLWAFICLPVWLVVLGSSAFSNSFVSQSD